MMTSSWLLHRQSIGWCHLRRWFHCRSSPDQSSRASFHPGLRPSRPLQDPLRKIFPSSPTVTTTFEFQSNYCDLSFQRDSDKHLIAARSCPFLFFDFYSKLNDEVTSTAFVELKSKFEQSMCFIKTIQIAPIYFVATVILWESDFDTLVREH